MSCGALLFLFCESTHPATNDLAIFLAQGREMQWEGGFADVDRFTHTVEGTSFLNGTWGTQRIFFLLWLLAGYGTLQLVLAISVCATVFLTAWGARRAGRTGPVAAFGALLAVWLVVQNLGLRPQLFALPLFAAYATIAMTFRPTWRAGLVSALLVGVWANLHGSFVIAPILSLCVALGIAWEHASAEHGSPTEKLRAALAGDARAHVLIAIAAGIAACVNPYGPAIWRYVAENSSSPSSRGLSEWARTTITDACGVRLMVAWIALGLVIARKKRIPPPRDALAMVAFTFLALTAIRHVVWTGMVLPIALARLLAPTPKEEAALAAGANDRRVHPAFAAAFAAFWLFLLVGQSPWVKVREKNEDDEVAARFTKDTPARIAAWAADNGVEGRLFNSMEWGGYLVWRIPGVQAFVDARIWIFPDDVWQEYLAISGAFDGWEDALDRRDVRWAILEKRFQARLVTAMDASPRWERVYDDELGAVYRRRESAPPPSL